MITTKPMKQAVRDARRNLADGTFEQCGTGSVRPIRPCEPRFLLLYSQWNRRIRGASRCRLV
ncbi:hypothetical protein [Alicyclobacillus sendaiensis]|uniref:hypothetical protein n=1 Tax=Alicyclobacillus sendaiensis TaxID=192387 RepID=UPI0014706133|nr:hypothetical protein [Alicyclobacillus sendaiensis]